MYYGFENDFQLINYKINIYPFKIANVYSVITLYISGQTVDDENESFYEKFEKSCYMMISDTLYKSVNGGDFNAKTRMKAILKPTKVPENVQTSVMTTDLD